MTGSVAGDDSAFINTDSPILEGKRLRRVAEDGTVLLADLSLAIAAGEVVGIVGPPGAGKSLLLRALALLDPLDGGEVRFRGEPVAAEDVPAFRRSVLYVQQRAILVEGTVRDNLLLPFSFRSAKTQSFNTARVIEWLSVVDRSSDFLDRSVAALSGGESQLVALLRGLQLDPHVLLLDEPTSSLDEQSRMKVERLLTEWMHVTREGEAPAEPRSDVGEAMSARREPRPPKAPRPVSALFHMAPATHTAMVIVTHDESQAKRLCDRRVKLQQGRVVEDRRVA